VLDFTNLTSIATKSGHAMTSVTLSSKFQLSIPKAVREELHLQAGQRFAVITKGDIISLVPIPELAEMRGIAKGADTSNYRDRTDRLERYK
jgi:AbrB family looped-hinge helix DNA binding protein